LNKTTLLSLTRCDGDAAGTESARDVFSELYSGIH